MCHLTMYRYHVEEFSVIRISLELYECAWGDGNMLGGHTYGFTAHSNMV